MGDYSQISDFGPSAGLAPENDPLTYCTVSGLDSGFNHTLGGGNSYLGPNSSACQNFMAQYCSKDWNGVCRYMAQDQERTFPNTVTRCDNRGGPSVGPGIGNSVTKGEILIRNTAAEKYLVAMSGNCKRLYLPFDPTVASSPMIGYWVPNGNTCSGYGNCYGDTCVPIYDIDAKMIDKCPVMNAILDKPVIAMDILCGIYKTRQRTKRMSELARTRIGSFFMYNKAFQNYCMTH